MIIETKTPQETFEVGKKIGENAKPGQIYTLTGDLGVGKTVFTQGLGGRNENFSFGQLRNCCICSSCGR